MYSGAVAAAGPPLRDFISVTLGPEEAVGVGGYNNSKAWRRRSCWRVRATRGAVRYWGCPRAGCGGHLAMGEGCWAGRSVPGLRCSWSVMGDLAWSPSSESGGGLGCWCSALGRPRAGLCSRQRSRGSLRGVRVCRARAG